MLIYWLAAVRCIAVQDVVDAGALFAAWIAVAATHGSDAYWAATCAVVLLVEFLYPPSLSVTGTLSVAAHSIATSAFKAKHAGAIAIALLSLAKASNQQWLAQRLKRL